MHASMVRVAHQSCNASQGNLQKSMQIKREYLLRVLAHNVAPLLGYMEHHRDAMSRAAQNLGSAR